MTTPLARKCADCYHFFDADSDDQKGICKLNPPQAFPVQTVNAMQQPQLTVLSLPVNVNGDDWCGCWASRQMELEYRSKRN